MEIRKGLGSGIWELNLGREFGKGILELNFGMKFHIVPVTGLEYFRALKFSRLENFRALQSYGQNGGF